MIDEKSLETYHAYAIHRDANNLIIAPHKSLRPYISNYTFTKPKSMPKQQTILPSVSNTLVYSIGNNNIVNGLRGVNTKPTMIGSFASQFDFMFLIEFQAGGLYPFIKVDQNLLLDHSYSFENISKLLNKQIIEAYDMSSSISDLTDRLDTIFLSCLDITAINPALSHGMKIVQASNGLIRSKDLAREVFYSEKQLNRLFQRNIGTSVKSFSRIVRMKYAIDLLNQHISLSQLPEITGHYDLSHFIHDFQNVYGLTPTEYINKMSLFYNDPFKLKS